MAGGSKRPDQSPHRAIQASIAIAWVLLGLLLLVSQVVSAAGADPNWGGIWAVGALMLGIGAAILFLPWERWKPSAPLWLVPVVFAVFGLNYRLGNKSGFGYAMAFLAVYLFIGATQPRWTGLRLGPLLVVQYLAPLIRVQSNEQNLGIASAIFVIPFCLVAGEAVAWGMSRLRHSQLELAESNERYLLSFEDAPTGMAQILPDGAIAHVNRAFAELLGREIDDLIGENLQAIVLVADWEEVADGIGRLVSGESDRLRTERRLAVSGGELWVLLSLSLVRDQLGHPLYLFVHAEDVTDARSLRDRLVHAAEHDRLTGLPNRALFLDHLERSLNRAHCDMRQMALMFIDVDRFKEINDGLGHRAGDGVLRGVAERLRGALRPDDVVARYGGDEFTVVCEVGNEAEARRIADRLQEAMVSTSGSNGSPLVTLSIGIAVSDSAGCDASLLLHQADTAMYAVKNMGGDDKAVYRQGSQLRFDRAELTPAEVRAGFDRREFQLQYQPIVELATGRLLGLKVVPKWRHPAYGDLNLGELLTTSDFGSSCCAHQPLGAW